MQWQEEIRYCAGIYTLIKMLLLSRRVRSCRRVDVAGKLPGHHAGLSLVCGVVPYIIHLGTQVLQGTSGSYLGTCREHKLQGAPAVQVGLIHSSCGMYCANLPWSQVLTSA